MNEELMRRISDALDADGGVEADAELRALLAEDEEAGAYARDLEAIDGALRGLGERDREPDWDALAAGIDARLGAEDGAGLEDIGDVTAPPLFADATELAAERPAVEEKRPAQDPVFAAPPAAPNVQPREGQVVDLAARRRRRTIFATLGGLAAAAAVGLGVTAGLTTMGSDAEPMAAAPAMSEEAAPSVAEVPTGGGAPGWAGAGEGPMEPEPAADEMPAAAAAEPFLAEQAEAEAPAMERYDEGAVAAERRQAALPRRTARGAGGGSAQVVDPWGRDDDLGSGGALGGGAGGARTGARRGRAAARPAPAAPPPDPSPTALTQALRRAEPAVRRCMGEQREVARVRGFVDGNGRVVLVNVDPPFRGGPAGACIESAIRAVAMPATGARYSFDHTFRPAPIAGSATGTGTSNAARRPASRQRVAPAHESMADEAF